MDLNSLEDCCERRVKRAEFLALWCVREWGGDEDEDVARIILLPVAIGCCSHLIELLKWPHWWPLRFEFEPEGGSNLSWFAASSSLDFKFVLLGGPGTSSLSGSHICKNWTVSSLSWLMSANYKGKLHVGPLNVYQNLTLHSSISIISPLYFRLSINVIIRPATVESKATHTFLVRPCSLFSSLI